MDTYADNVRDLANHYDSLAKKLDAETMADQQKATIPYELIFRSDGRAARRHRLDHCPVDHQAIASHCRSLQ